MLYLVTISIRGNMKLDVKRPTRIALSYTDGSRFQKKRNGLKNKKESMFMQDKRNIINMKSSEKE